jgi:transglutaminase-like putative cysteine protease
MKDPNSTVLYPNQFCNYNSSTKTVKTGDELVAGISDTIEKVEAIYKYAVDNITYDYQKAKTVQSGYLPKVDDTLKTKKGICFDYSALMTTMLRTQNIPTRLEVGYVGEEYHAWISVYIKDMGWVNGIIEFDGTNWNLMDPTFASTSKSPKDYITKNSKYLTKYVY